MTRIVMRLCGMLCLVLVCAVPQAAHAYLDTYDGPVVKDAQRALEDGDVTPVLKWVNKESEPEVQDAFNKALEVRGVSPQVKEMSEKNFLETVVRLHLQMEGEAFTGIKPPGTPVPPFIREADNVLEKGQVDNLIRQMSDQATMGIKHKFADAFELKGKKDLSVEAGRAYVKAYVEFIRYLKNLDDAIKGKKKEHNLIETEV